MADSETLNRLKKTLVETAKAHHAATGGTNPRWAEWYAERMVDDLNEALGVNWSAERLATWLTEADKRYRNEELEVSWPHAYADWLAEATGA